uniref:Hypothetical secreted peptide n=1 Tax=Glossina morsitans morsitans TaxID=37546 RepID=D3TSN0_GLOMM
MFAILFVVIFLLNIKVIPLPFFLFHFASLYKHIFLDNKYFCNLFCARGQTHYC